MSVLVLRGGCAFCVVLAGIIRCLCCAVCAEVNGINGGLVRKKDTRLWVRFAVDYLNTKTGDKYKRCNERKRVAQSHSHNHIYSERRRDNPIIKLYNSHKSPRATACNRFSTRAQQEPHTEEGGCFGDSSDERRLASVVDKKYTYVNKATVHSDRK